MDNKSFDDLLQALQSAIVTAQATLNKKRDESIQRMYGVDETGKPGSPVYTFAIPRNGANEDEYEMLSIPASSFRMHHRPRISMLSLEFECELREKILFGATPAYTLAIKAGKQRGWWRKKRQMMRIVFNGTDQPSGEVRIDGELLMKIPQYGTEGGGGSNTETKQSIFLRLLEMLLNLWQPRKFILTAEQSERARQILKQSDLAASAR